MKSIQTLLTELYSALTAVEGLNVYHFERPEDFTLPYAVWGEDGEDGSFHADNHKQDQVITGYVDFFTETEFDPLADSIQGALDGVCAWKLNSVQYEDETKLIHYSWEWKKW